MRLTVRVRPGASRTRVGGSYGTGSPAQRPPLVVAVTARAVDGAATTAVLSAVADAFGVPRRSVLLISGAKSRTKLLELAPDPAGAEERLDALLGGS